PGSLGTSAQLLLGPVEEQEGPGTCGATQAGAVLLGGPGLARGLARGHGGHGGHWAQRPAGVLASRRDFRMNTSTPHASGAFLLELAGLSPTHPQQEQRPGTAAGTRGSGPAVPLSPSLPALTSPGSGPAEEPRSAGSGTALVRALSFCEEAGEGGTCQGCPGLPVSIQDAGEEGEGSAHPCHEGTGTGTGGEGMASGWILGNSLLQRAVQPWQWGGVPIPAGLTSLWTWHVGTRAGVALAIFQPNRLHHSLLLPSAAPALTGEAPEGIPWQTGWEWGGGSWKLLQPLPIPTSPGAAEPDNDDVPGALEDNMEVTPVPNEHIEAQRVCVGRGLGGCLCSFPGTPHFFPGAPEPPTPSPEPCVPSLEPWSPLFLSWSPPVLTVPPHVPQSTPRTRGYILRERPPTQEPRALSKVRGGPGAGETPNPGRMGPPGMAQSPCPSSPLCQEEPNPWQSLDPFGDSEEKPFRKGIFGGTGQLQGRRDSTARAGSFLATCPSVSPAPQWGIPAPTGDIPSPMSPSPWQVLPSPPVDPSQPPWTSSSVPPHDIQRGPLPLPAPRGGHTPVSPMSPAGRPFLVPHGLDDMVGGKRKRKGPRKLQDFTRWFSAACE
ncbi:hypothetical protein DV515_00018925, partial [Chloebia gouldiae]